MAAWTRIDGVGTAGLKDTRVEFKTFGRRLTASWKKPAAVPLCALTGDLRKSTMVVNSDTQAALISLAARRQQRRPKPTSPRGVHRETVPNHPAWNRFGSPRQKQTICHSDSNARSPQEWSVRHTLDLRSFKDMRQPASLF